MNGQIPKSPTWCSYCLQDENGRKPAAPCQYHAGPEGTSVDYTGHDVYEPSDWVLEVVAGLYKSWDGVVHECIGYDPRHGFWMQTVSGETKRSNISERAVGRTWHKVTKASSRTDHMRWAKQRALEYITLGDWEGAIASMASDLQKHPETSQLNEIVALGILTTRTAEQARQFIDGFAE